MKICYQDHRFSDENLRLVELSEGIVIEYLEQGFDLTLRQLYYQMVSRDYIPNTQKSYSRLGDLISNARLAGLIDWDAIVDRTRTLRSLPHWDAPEDIISSAAIQFRMDKWYGQTYRPEVWIEKDALIGVIQPICNELDISYFACRGYPSQSELWAASIRFRKYMREGQTPIILHFGDHDPSGIDMTRDLVDRMRLFGNEGGFYLPSEFRVERLALNMDQVRKYDPPPNPAKITDSRATAYIAEYGAASWELDALEPRVLAHLIEDAVTRGLRNDTLWRKAVSAENEQRTVLTAISNNYSAVTTFLGRENE